MYFLNVINIFRGCIVSLFQSSRSSNPLLFFLDSRDKKYVHMLSRLKNVIKNVFSSFFLHKLELDTFLSTKTWLFTGFSHVSVLLRWVLHLRNFYDIFFWNFFRKLLNWHDLPCLQYHLSNIHNKFHHQRESCLSLERLSRFWPLGSALGKRRFHGTLQRSGSDNR